MAMVVLLLLRQVPRSKFTTITIYLPIGFCDRNCVILQTNRARCALNKESLIYSTRIAFLEHAEIELVYNFDEKSTVSV